MTSTKTTPVPDAERCGICNGTGDDYENEGTSADCFDCGGTGLLGGGS